MRFHEKVVFLFYYYYLFTTIFYCNNLLRTFRVSVWRYIVKMKHVSALTYKTFLLRDAPASLIFNHFTLCPHCIYVFCIYLRRNSDLCSLHHKLIGFYNRDEKCLQRGTDWVFKYSSLRFVSKWLKALE